MKLLLAIMALLAFLPFYFIVMINLMINPLFLIGNQGRGGSNHRSRYQPDIS